MGESEIEEIAGLISRSIGGAARVVIIADDGSKLKIAMANCPPPDLPDYLGEVADKVEAMQEQSSQLPPLNPEPLQDNAGEGDEEFEEEETEF